MLIALLKCSKVLYFVGGAVAAVAGQKAVKSGKVRALCVSGLAAGMKLQKEAQVAFQNIKEEAVDICYDAAKKTESEE